MVGVSLLLNLLLGFNLWSTYFQAKEIIVATLSSYVVKIQFNYCLTTAKYAMVTAKRINLIFFSPKSQK